MQQIRESGICLNFAEINEFASKERRVKQKI